MDANMARQLLGAQADTARPAGLEAVAGLARVLVARVAAWRRYRRDVRELSHMDTRMLKDIGIDRGSLERALRTGRRD